MIKPVTYRRSAVLLGTLLLVACGKDPAPLSSLPPATELPKVTTQQISPEQQTKQKELDIRRGQDEILTGGDYDRGAVTGKSGKLCTSTCQEQSSVEACKAAITADGCVEARDDWRAKNPDKRGFGDVSGSPGFGNTTGVTTGGRAQMRQSRAY